MPFGNTGNQVGAACRSEGGRKSTYDRHDFPLEPERFQGFIYRPLVKIVPQVGDVPAGSIAGRSDLTPAKRMPDPHDTNEVVPEQRLRTHLWTHGLPNDACFQVDASVAQWRAVSVWLRHKPQPQAGSFLADASNEIRSEVLDEAFAGPQCERSDEPIEVEPPGRAQNRLSVLHEPTDPVAEFERAGGGNKAASGPDKKRIARRLAQSRERPAHRRGAEPQPLSCARDATFGEQHIKRDKQIEIGVRHEWML